MSVATVTQLLTDHRAGDQQAADRLLPLLYEELRAIAGDCMQRERAGTRFSAPEALTTPLIVSS